MSVLQLDDKHEIVALKGNNHSVLEKIASKYNAS